MIIHDVQQGSAEWFELRLGKVTGSRLKDVFKADNLSLIDELIAEQLTEIWEENDYLSEAMQRGVDEEPNALRRYEELHGVELIRGGFIQSEEFPLLGYSPDGRVGLVGGVEIKCPSSKKHIQYCRMNKLPGEHKWQVYDAFIVNKDLQWYDFMSYDPRVQQRPEFIIRTYRKDIESELLGAVAELKKFFAKLERYKEEILFPITQTA